MKKNLVILTLIGLLLMPAILLVQAAAPGVSTTSPITSLADILAFIVTVGTWISAIVIGLAVIFILVSAFQFLTAAGNPETIAKARQNLIYALVAVAIAVVAWGLPTIVQELLGVTTP